MAYLLSNNVKNTKILYETVTRRETDGRPLETFLCLELPDQTEIYFECSLVSDERRREFKIIGTEGIIRFDMLGNPTFSEIILKKEQCGYSVTKEEKLNYDEKNNLSLALNDFYHKICHKEEGNIDIAESVAIFLDLVNNFTK